MSEQEIRLNPEAVANMIEEQVKRLVFEYASARDDDLRAELDKVLERQSANIQNIDQRLTNLEGL